MILRLLIGLATAGTVAGAATAFALTNGSSNSRDNAEASSKASADLSPEVRKEGKTDKREDELESEPEEANITQTIVPQIKVEQQKEFVGKLVFNRENKASNQLDKKLNLIYKGQLFTDDEYLQKEKKWKEDQEDDDDFKEAHITINLSFGKTKKTQQKLQEYLDKLNDKLEKATGNHLEKLKTTIEDDTQDFQGNFGEESFKELLKKIEELKKPSRN